MRIQKEVLNPQGGTCIGKVKKPFAKKFKFLLCCQRQKWWVMKKYFKKWLRKNRKKRAWVKENWVDIANPRSDGSFLNVVEVVERKRKKYPKCVPIAKASKNVQRGKKSAVSRKQKAGNTGPKPFNGQNNCQEKTSRKNKR